MKNLINLLRVRSELKYGDKFLAVNFLPFNVPVIKRFYSTSKRSLEKGRTSQISTKIKQAVVSALQFLMNMNNFYSKFLFGAPQSQRDKAQINENKNY